ncbi:MAG: hypothetical protein KBS94_00575 [Prevotella sp.]|nr:hypothetical protein [Candidatus Equicola faecalis]
MKRQIIVLLVCFAGMMCTTSCQESLPERCQREAKEYTEKNCPVKVENNVILDSMTFDRKTLTINYFYTLENELDDETVIDTQADNLHTLMLNALKNATNIKLYKENGYNFHYIYLSRKDNRKKLLDILLKKEDYQ